MARPPMTMTDAQQRAQLELYHAEGAEFLRMDGWLHGSELALAALERVPQANIPRLVAASEEDTGQAQCIQPASRPMLASHILQTHVQPAGVGQAPFTAGDTFVNRGLGEDEEMTGLG